MTTLEIYQTFLQIMVDKYGDPSIEANEFTNTFNQCALAELKDDFNNRQNRNANSEPMYGMEMSQTDLDKWYTLVYPITLANHSGTITVAEIETAIGGQMFHTSTLLRNQKYARYVRHNSYGRHIENEFLKPTDEQPTWRGFNNKIDVQPPNNANFELTVWKYPRKIVLDETDPANNINPDLTDNAINSIIVRMTSMFGTKIREQQLVVDADNKWTKE